MSSTSRLFVARDAPMHSIHRHAYVCPSDYLEFVVDPKEIVEVEVTSSSSFLTMRLKLTVNEGMPKGMIGIESSDRAALDLQPFSSETCFVSPAREVVKVTKVAK